MSRPLKRRLVIVARAPLPGRVKTRLAANLTPEQTIDLYCCFLADLRAEMSALGTIDRAVYFTPADAGDHFSAFAAAGFALFPQTDGDLGTRQHHIFAEQAAAGYDAVTLIGSDIPDLPRHIVLRSFELLASGTADAVFGPSVDGGYYLVGLRRPRPELFQDIPWSTAKVLGKTLAVAAKLKLKTKLLPLRRDLDTFEDLRAFYRRYKDRPPAPGRAGAQTVALLKRLEGSFEF